MRFLLPIVFLFQFALPPATTAPSVPFYGLDFAVRVSPTRPSMVQGGTTSFDLFIDSSRPIVFSLKLEGIPPAVRPDIPKLVPGINTITLSCPPNTPNGTYAIQVTVAGGQNQQTQTFALDITPPKATQ